jgi:hypothetical protein
MLPLQRLPTCRGGDGVWEWFCQGCGQQPEVFLGKGLWGRGMTEGAAVVVLPAGQLGPGWCTTPAAPAVLPLPTPHAAPCACDNTFWLVMHRCCSTAVGRVLCKHGTGSADGLMLGQPMLANVGAGGGFSAAAMLACTNPSRNCWCADIPSW